MSNGTYNTEETLSRDELRSLIIQYKNDGYSYVEISEILLKKYGIKRDRQAIYGMYTRAMKREMKEEIDSVLRSFIINLRAIGYNPLQISELAQASNRTSLTYYKVRNFCKSISEEKDNIKSNNIMMVARLIHNGADRNEIIDGLTVYGIQPTEASLDEHISEATKLIIAKEAERHMAVAYKLMVNKDEAFGLLGDIEKYVDKGRIRNKAK